MSRGKYKEIHNKSLFFFSRFFESSKRKMIQHIQGNISKINSWSLI